MNKTILITLGALLRRLAIAAGVGVATYLMDVWPDLLKKAMEQDAKTIVWIPTLWILVEVIQKYLRERKKETAVF